MAKNSLISKASQSKKKSQQFSKSEQNQVAQQEKNKKQRKLEKQKQKNKTNNQKQYQKSLELISEEDEYTNNEYTKTERSKNQPKEQQILLEQKCEVEKWSKQRSECELAESILQHLQIHQELMSNRKLRVKVEENLPQPEHSIKEGLYHPHFNEYSLREQILRKIESTQKANEEAKKEISKLFLDGVELKRSIFSQYRVDLGLSTKQKRVPAQINRNNSLKYQITFCPTYFITARIFNYFLEIQNQRKIYAGNFGFSKTFSAILYSQLTNYIIRHRIKNGTAQLSQSILNRAKVFYWTLNEDQSSKLYNKVSEQYEFNFVKENCEEVKDLFEEYKKKGGYDVNKDGGILAIYKNLKIKRILIIDQINTLASFYRDEQYCQQIERKKQNNQQLSQFDQKNYQIAKEKSQLNKKYFTAIKKKINQISRQFDHVVYLSSINIEQHLLKKIDKQLSKKYQRFTSKFYQNENHRLELVDFFIFMFGEKINVENLNSIINPSTDYFDGIQQDWHIRNDSEDIQAIITKKTGNRSNDMQMKATGENNKKDMTYFQLRKKLRKQLQKILNEDSTSFINQLSIAEYLSNSKIHSNYYNSLEKEKIDKLESLYQFKDLSEKNKMFEKFLYLIQDKFRSCLSMSNRFFRDKVFQFYQKEQNLAAKELKIKILAQAYLSALRSENKNEIIFLPKTLFDPEEIKTIDQQLGLSRSKELFFNNNFQNNHLQSICPGGLLIKILKKAPRMEVIDYAHENFISWFSKRADFSYLGIWFEMLLVIILETFKMNIYFKLQKGRQEFELFGLKQKVFALAPIPTDSEDIQYSIEQALRPILKTFLEDSEKSKSNIYTRLCLFKRKHSQSIYIQDLECNNHRSNNKGFDFILLKRDKLKQTKKNQKKYIKVWAFDATITTKNNKKKQKQIKISNIVKAFKKDSKMAKQNNCIIQTNFFVLGLKYRRRSYEKRDKTMASKMTGISSVQQPQNEFEQDQLESQTQQMQSLKNVASFLDINDVEFISLETEYKSQKNFDMLTGNFAFLKQKILAAQEEKRKYENQQNKNLRKQKAEAIKTKDKETM